MTSSLQKQYHQKHNQQYTISHGNNHEIAPRLETLYRNKDTRNDLNNELNFIKNQHTQNTQHYSSFSRHFSTVGQIRKPSTQKCDGKECLSAETTICFNGNFCNKHRQRLLIIRSMMRRYKGKDIIMELGCRKLEAKVRYLDYGHMQRILTLEKQIYKIHNKFMFE